MDLVEFCKCDGNGEVLPESDGKCVHCGKVRDAEGVKSGDSQGVAKEGVGDEIVVEKPLTGAVLTVEDKEGGRSAVIVLKVDVKRCGASVEGVDQFVGFMERWKQTGINLMAVHLQKMAAKQDSQKLVKPGFRPGFFERMRKGLHRA